MECLKDKTEVATGDPIYCSECKAIFNKYSQVEDKKELEE